MLSSSAADLPEPAPQSQLRREATQLFSLNVARQTARVLIDRGFSTMKRSTICGSSVSTFTVTKLAMCSSHIIKTALSAPCVLASRIRYTRTISLPLFANEAAMSEWK